MSGELGIKLHRSFTGVFLRTTMEFDDGEQKPQEHTQEVCRRMHSDAFLVQQTSHTNVCSPAVRLKSMTLSCCHKLAAELFASVMMKKKTSHSPLSPLLSLAGALTQASPSAYMTSAPSYFHFSGS